MKEFKSEFLLESFEKYLSVTADVEYKFGENLEFRECFIQYFIHKFDPLIINRNILILKNSFEKTINNHAENLLFNFVISAVRTNCFLPHRNDELAIKFDVANFKKLIGEPQPNIETWVYSKDFIGTHLRMAKVSRGGLRWSERIDFRDEVKALMLAQDAKNSIIVPSGGKGGFLILDDKKNISKDKFKNIYSRYINNLLDLVDNLKNGEIIAVDGIIKYDGDDSYFVVAADKGTASMSDVANEIAISRGFWLGDAFASGGSNGYSHKDLGITAKGALVSTSKFFENINKNLEKDVIELVGIGSMNGDVFGNGLLWNENFKLIGAISSSEIFVDPNPIDLKKSFAERMRLFKAENGSWGAYDKSLISTGGGVYNRKDKNIEISPEIADKFNITEKYLTGEELGKYLLKAKVDLLFNGGVGTYVKGSNENDDDIGDFGNKHIRVSGSELRAFAVCEGGNLGFSQLGRIEFAQNGGKINLDSIDNSAGVNTSDHEVNIKILLSQTGLSHDQQIAILKQATDEVAESVLAYNRNSAEGLNHDEIRLNNDNSQIWKVIEKLENELPQFKREFFAIPKDKDESFGKLYRPQLAYIYSYAKLLIKNKKIAEKFVDQDFLSSYFPKSIRDKFENEILNHPLKLEISATLYADKLINLNGVEAIL